MEDDDRRATKRNRESNMNEEEELLEGRIILRVKNNDDAALAGAESLFIMNQQVLDVGNAVQLLESIEHNRICIANTFCPKVELHHRHCRGNQVQPQLFRRFEEQPPFGYSIDGTKLPRFPPLNRLKGIIESCSYPFQKQVTDTDKRKSHNRLSLNRDDVKHAILPLLYFLGYGEEDVETGIPVTTYDTKGEKKYSMVFKVWADRKAYVLHKEGWNEFISDNELIGCTEWLSVWAFSMKQSGELCFALNLKRFPTPKLIKKRSKRN